VKNGTQSEGQDDHRVYLEKLRRKTLLLLNTVMVAFLGKRESQIKLRHL
jgi:hypothetical protein